MKGGRSIHVGRERRLEEIPYLLEEIFFDVFEFGIRIKRYQGFPGCFTSLR